MPRRREEKDEDEEERDWPPPPKLPQEVADMRERKRQKLASQKAAQLMAAEVFARLREYKDRLQYVPFNTDELGN